MKKRLRILGVVVLVLSAALLILNLPGPTPAPTVAVGFLGFTNSIGRVEALFAISNPPNSAVSLHSVRLKDANGSSPSNTDRGNFSWVRRETWGLAYAITVDMTNEPLRVIFQFQRPAFGPRWIIERIKEFVEKLKGRDITLFTGSKFFVTNETRVVGAP
jgi:hypothetical protein